MVTFLESTTRSQFLVHSSTPESGLRELANVYAFHRLFTTRRVRLLVEGRSFRNIAGRWFSARACVKVLFGGTAAINYRQLGEHESSCLCDGHLVHVCMIPMLMHMNQGPPTMFRSQLHSDDSQPSPDKAGIEPQPPYPTQPRPSKAKKRRISP